mgnify:CR=1 FL=1
MILSLRIPQAETVCDLDLGSLYRFFYWMLQYHHKFLDDCVPVGSDGPAELYDAKQLLALFTHIKVPAGSPSPPNAAPILRELIKNNTPHIRYHFQ